MAISSKKSLLVIPSHIRWQIASFKSKLIGDYFSTWCAKLHAVLILFTFRPVRTILRISWRVYHLTYILWISNASCCRSCIFSRRKIPSSVIFRTRLKHLCRNTSRRLKIAPVYGHGHCWYCDAFEE